MYEANFWHIVLKMLNYIPHFYSTNLEELASTINNSFTIMYKQELNIKEKFSNKFLIIQKYIRRHEEIEITLLELDILKMMLIRLYESDFPLENYKLLKQHILILISCIERLTFTLEKCDYKNMFRKKEYLKHQ